MINSHFTKKMVINYLVYCKGETIDQASFLYNHNKQAFTDVFDTLGEEFCVELLKKIAEDSKEGEETYGED